ncbi:MAG TPA: type III-B CRISPR module RAMP protein Cmr4 [Syntrophomonadaceae bacterium]|nr:type III-B CRISPR module RAMP protein Cmr4 [Syntrophomonadaceae bacterium]
MRSMLLGLLAETSLHPGIGQVVGAVDLPVAREKTTDYPVIFGSSLKGALRDRAEQVWGTEDERVKRIFGEQESAGAIAVTDARLLLLPVRSLSGHFKWLTCPYLLERYSRDLKLAGIEAGDLPLPQPAKGQAVMNRDHGENQTQLFLEELSFDVILDNLTPIVESISSLIRYASVRERLVGGIVIVSDEEFAYFARYSLPVNARNVLENDTKTSMNLWHEETIPPDTLFYALLFERSGKDGLLEELEKIFRERPYLQVGGNETIGQGWCSIGLRVSRGDAS